MKCKLKKTLIITFIILFILSCWFLFCYIIYNTIILSSYYSTIVNCKTNGVGVAESNGYIVAGQTTTNNINDNIKIEIFYPSNDVYLHEYCHALQKIEHRRFDCNFIIGNFLNEIECYSIQYLPIKVN